MLRSTTPLFQDVDDAHVFLNKRRRSVDDTALSLLPLVEEHQAQARSHVGACIAMRADNKFRMFWTSMIVMLLVYTGTIFLYRLCFIDFRIQWPFPDDSVATPQVFDTSDSVSIGFGHFDTAVTVVFWVDLFMNCLFTYEDQESQVEIDDIRFIARHYLERHFSINLLACLPEGLIEALISGISGNTPDQLNRGVRALRLRRVSRLARLLRLTQLGKLNQMRRSRFFQWFQRQKGMRGVNLLVALAWISHVMACGWYLCASLHTDIEDTWVWRRQVDASGRLLVECDPAVQWMHSMYFVLTVFTTIGFGDISAYTIGEIIYCGCTMGVGAILHSVFIGEVINMVMAADQTNIFIQKNCDLVDSFAKHTELTSGSSRSLKAWIGASARRWISQRYNREEMRELITDKHIPREIMDKLPFEVFGGRLIQNRFLNVCAGVVTMPQRLPLLLALALQKCFFSVGELIFQSQDYPFGMCLVVSGTFAFIGKPGRSGGVQHEPRNDSKPRKGREHKRRNTGTVDALTRVAAALKARSPKAGNFNLSDTSLQQDLLFPYVLFGAGSYFGEAELVRSGPRTSTTRCESEEGIILWLSKAAFADLSAEFPHFGERWALAATYRSKVHQGKLKLLTLGRTYRIFAAYTIRTWWLSMRQRGRWARVRAAMWERQPMSSHGAVHHALTDKAVQLDHSESLGDAQLRGELRDLRFKIDDLAKKMDLLLSDTLDTSMRAPGCLGREGPRPPAPTKY